MGAKVIDLTGQKFGRWLAQYETGGRRYNDPVWHCMCDCGTERDVGGSSLRDGSSKSCGCITTSGARFRKTLKDRFELHVVRKDGGCWNWAGSVTEKGYGRFSTPGQVLAAHRVAYEIYIRPIPDGLCVCHHCDNPACVNTDHLFLGTNGDNVQDSVLKMRRATGDKNASRLYPERVPRGEEHSYSKMTNEAVKQLRLRYATGGIPLRKLSTEYGIHINTARAIVNRKTWAHVE